MERDCVPKCWGGYNSNSWNESFRNKQPVEWIGGPKSLFVFRAVSCFRYWLSDLTNQGESHTKSLQNTGSVSYCGAFQKQRAAQLQPRSRMTMYATNNQRERKRERNKEKNDDTAALASSMERDGAHYDNIFWFLFLPVLDRGTPESQRSVARRFLA